MKVNYEKKRMGGGGVKVITHSQLYRLSNKLEIQHNDPIMEKKWDRKLKKKKKKKKRKMKRKSFSFFFCVDRRSRTLKGGMKNKPKLQKTKKERKKKQTQNFKKLKKERKALKIREQQTKNSSINILKVKSL